MNALTKKRCNQIIKSFAAEKKVISAARDRLRSLQSEIEESAEKRWSHWTTPSRPFRSRLSRLPRRRVGLRHRGRVARAGMDGGAMSSPESVVRRLVAQQGVTTSTAFEAGYDSVISGANMINTHFRWFSRPELTQAWERGAAQARKVKP